MKQDNYIIYFVGTNRLCLDLTDISLTNEGHATIFPNKELARLFALVLNRWLAHTTAYKVSRCKRVRKVFRMIPDEAPLAANYSFNENVTRYFPYLGVFARISFYDDYLHNFGAPRIVINVYATPFVKRAADREKSHYVQPFALFEHKCPPCHSRDEYLKYFHNFCDNIEDIQDDYRSQCTLFDNINEREAPK